MTSNMLESTGKAYTYINTQLVKTTCIEKINNIKEKRKEETNKTIERYRQFLANAKNSWTARLLIKLKLCNLVPEPTFEDAKQILDALSAKRTCYYNYDIHEFYPSVSYDNLLVFFRQLIKMCDATQEEKILLSVEAIDVINL